MDKKLLIDEYLQGKHPIEGKSWDLPTEGELNRDEALFDALLAENKKASLLGGRFGRGLLSFAAVLAIVFALFTWKNFKPKDQPQLAEKKEELVPQEDTPKVVEKDNVDKSQTSHVKLANITREVEQLHTRRLRATQPKEEPPVAIKAQETPVEPLPREAEAEPASEQEAPLIPADKQALVDIFLAEEALQVAYELRAQREAIRAYAASLTGRELTKPIITF